MLHAANSAATAAPTTAGARTKTANAPRPRRFARAHAIPAGTCAAVNTSQTSALPTTLAPRLSSPLKLKRASANDGKHTAAYIMALAITTTTKFAFNDSCSFEVAISKFP